MNPLPSGICKVLLRLCRGLGSRSDNPLVACGKVKPDYVNKTMCDSAHLIALLENALQQPKERRNLLQYPEKLQAIMRNIPVRRWLFEQASQTHDRNRAIKARLFIVEIMQYSGQIWKGG